MEDGRSGGTSGSAARWGKRPDMVVHEEEPFNAEPPLAALADALVTPPEAFYVRSHGPVPEVAADTWSLEVRVGDADPVSFDLARLQQDFEHHHRLVTLQCAGNRRSGLVEVRDIPGEAPWAGGTTSTAWWTGVLLADVLRAAGLEGATGPADRRHVALEAPDVSQDAHPPQAYGSSVPLVDVVGAGALLVWGMGEEPLPAVHGGPVRVVVPGYVGARSVKWVERVTVQEEPSDNYFQAVAYRVLPPEADPDAAGPGDGISLGPVALNCEVLVPAEGAEVGPGPVRVAGYAHAGAGRHVARVDVSPDGGETWVQAALTEQVDGAWRLWEVELVLGAGASGRDHAWVRARAWDDTGACQPESPATLWNPKGYVNNSWAGVRVRPV